MKDVHITANSWIPIGVAATAIGFITASALWAAQIEAKAQKALDYQEKYESVVEQKLSGLDKRLERIEDKIDAMKGK
jgi:hypothetical protein